MNTAQQILDRINGHAGTTTAQDLGLAYGEREVVLAEVKVVSHETREVSKDKKIKRYKDTSRLGDEEEMRFKNLTEQDKTTTTATASVTKIEPPRELTSRTFTGISVQHSRTKTGVRLAITLQTEQQSLVGEVSLLTAELKRYDRLREIKSRPDIDSDWFQDHLEDTKRMIRDTDNHNLCLGRIHARGKRASWYQDCFVVGVLDGQNRIVKVVLNLEGEEYEIDLELGLTERQLANYLTGGIYGQLKQPRQSAPRLSNAPSVKFCP